MRGSKEAVWLVQGDALHRGEDVEERLEDGGLHIELHYFSGVGGGLELGKEA